MTFRVLVVIENYIRRIRVIYESVSNAMSSSLLFLSVPHSSLWPRESKSAEDTPPLADNAPLYADVHSIDTAAPRSASRHLEER